MMHSKPTTEELIDKYISGNCTPEEAKLMESIYEEAALKKEIKDAALDFGSVGKESWAYIHASINKKPQGIYKLWMRIAVAASVLVALGTGIWWYTSRQAVNRNAEVVTQNSIVPGKNRASLILANGQTIDLSDAKTGVVIDASSLKYNDGSEVASVDVRSSSNATILTAITPRGGQYQVTLPDGTRVWLNAQSSLKFPATFKKLDHRTVELSGEAFFEVFADSKHPFIVKTATQNVEVLGTHFNVNSYPDEIATTTTLVEGRVHISGRGIGGNLKPGEQSVLNTKSNQLKIGPANVKEAIAWKNGYFRFNEQRIDEIMLRLSRWYDIEVVYQGKVPVERFSGHISRAVDIRQVLNMFSYGDAIRFKIEGRRVTVME